MSSFPLTFRVDTVLLIFSLKFCRLDIEIFKKEVEFLKEEKTGIKKEDIQSISYNTGIFIRINEIEFWSDEFNKNSYFLLFEIACLSVLAVIIFLFFFFGVPGIFLIFAMVIILAILFPWALIREKETAEWHGCKHKLIFLLIKGLELNLENLEKAPMFIKGCMDYNRTLKEPPQEKLMETLRLGKKILQQLSIQNYPVKYN